MSDFCPDTRGAVVDTFLRFTCSVALWGGRDAANNQHWPVLAVSRPHWACPCSRCLCPPCPHCSGSRLLHREPSEACPGLHAPPRSKLLRFRQSGSPQRCRLCWACVLCPSQVSSSGDEEFGERGRCDLSPPPSLPLRFVGIQLAHLLRRMLTVQNPKKF